MTLQMFTNFANLKVFFASCRHTQLRILHVRMRNAQSLEMALILGFNYLKKN